MWAPAATPAAAAELRRAGYPPWLAALLARRGVRDRAAAELFLRPGLDQLHDPGELAGMTAAVERLLRARRDGESVAVVGDYDVDGVSGTALLAAVMRACGLEVVTILPHRLRDGYGFQPAHAERAHRLGCKVVVTVDCGTTSARAAAVAGELGLDVVITDHHLPGPELPPAVVQINPQQEACTYPFAELSGAGLAFKLALALAAACGRRPPVRQLLRIACLGTIADLVLLTGENRVIAAIGLAELGRTRSPGLRALAEVARLKPPFTTDDVGYRLGPRLNAPGRLDDAGSALELLLCGDPHRARQLAAQLDALNRERQQRELRVVEEAREVFLARSSPPPILVAWRRGWHRGVVGIAAGRLARELNRPAILLGLEDDSATGSGRSVAGIHLHRFLAPWRAQLERFGGHAQAVGMTVARRRLETLRAGWEEAAEAWREHLAVRRYEYEIELAPGRIDRRLVAELQRLEPHGQGNPRPLVKVCGPLELAAPPRLFGRDHLAAQARGADGGRLRLVGWGWARRQEVLAGGFEVLGHLELDRYHGGVVLRLLDGRPYRPPEPQEAPPAPED